MPSEIGKVTPALPPNVFVQERGIGDFKKGILELHDGAGVLCLQVSVAV